MLLWTVFLENFFTSFGTSLTNEKRSRAKNNKNGKNLQFSYVF